MPQTISCPFCNQTNTIAPCRVAINNHFYDVYKCPDCGSTLASIDAEQEERNHKVDTFMKRQQELMNINSKDS